MHSWLQSTGASVVCGSVVDGSVVGGSVVGGSVVGGSVVSGSVVCGSVGLDSSSRWQITANFSPLTFVSLRRRGGEGGCLIYLYILRTYPHPMSLQSRLLFS